MVEKGKEYVQAARVIGLPDHRILFQHILPNVMRPVLVIGTIGLALAIIAEATLSFLGVGMPATQPSLGTLIRVGQDYMFSGEWWIRSEEHTSELQSRPHLVCRLLLEKKKQIR